MEEEEEDRLSNDELMDDWLIESIKLYNNLHAFELQDPTKVIEWTGEKSICVAGFKSGGRSEILELTLPQKLCAKEDQGLCPERDFKMEHGGFSERPIYCLKHVQGTRLLVSSGPPDNSLQIWQIGVDDSDVIRLLNCINNEEQNNHWSKIATSAAGSPCVLHGTHVKNLQVTEIESTKNVFLPGIASVDLVSSLEFLSKDAFLLCSVRGQMWLMDMRQQKVVAAQDVCALPAEDFYWCMGVERRQPDLDAVPCRVAKLSSTGYIFVSDVRNLAKHMCQTKVSIPSPVAENKFMNVSWAPALDNNIAVSGFSGSIEIYNITSWHSTDTEACPMFVHKGHTVLEDRDKGEIPLVTAHTWHPWKPRTVLSAATDGSLQVWEWR
ncbi:WD repeat-containing protein 73 isoform X1 [Erpetoichthys calabaricus]|uniref:WD repeat domain 73 n=1 Tax=Erpetoichthys calabaricus TaxID=27687 RepID=A0A8C4RX29_ERPCA|nr:WD repeat-containing protein 73 isoform X1 [Erpetoichthys calabaricus]